MADRQNRCGSSRPGRPDGERPRGSRFPNGPDWSDNRQRWGTAAWVVAAIALFFLLQGAFGSNAKTIEFSKFLEFVDQHKVTQVSISSDTVSGSFRTSGDSGTQAFTTTRPPDYSVTKLVNELHSQGVEIKGRQPSGWESFIAVWVFPFLLFFAIYWFFMRRMRSQFGGGSGGP